MTTLLLLAALLGFGYVAGRVHEGCRKGGTLDLQTTIALAADDLEQLSQEIRETRRRAGL